MYKFFGLALAAVVAMASVAPARAETQEEQAYGFGQFAGASVFCGVSQADVTTFSEKLLRSVGVDTDTANNPAMAKFTEGVTAGVIEMRDHPQVDCDTVKTMFADMNKKLQ